jgi:hypothetical protein
MSPAEIFKRTVQWLAAGFLVLVVFLWCAGMHG